MVKGTSVLQRSIRIFLFASAFIGILSIIIEYGFNLSPGQSEIFQFVSVAVVIIFLIYQMVSFFISESKKEYIKSHLVESVIFFLIIFELILTLTGNSLLLKIGERLRIKDITYLYIVAAQIYIVLGVIAGTLRINSKILESKIHPARLFIGSFLVTIFVGAGLLMLPAATTTGKISFADALFTSTSAVCVTGLITVDTATYFTLFGKIVILGLIQIGGLGLMTFTTFFALFLAGGLGLKEKFILREMMHEDNLGAITKVIVQIILTTLIIELIGAVFLFFSIKDYYTSIPQAIGISVFHSVSAFCNAGFSVYTLNMADVVVRNNTVFIITVSLLIILGGIGFTTILNFHKFFKYYPYYNRFKVEIPLQYKMVIFTSIALIVAGTFMTYLFEYQHSLKEFSTGERLLHSYFQSVSTRTAGFNTIDISRLTMPTSLFYIFLMFVGASPGGTGGGIKTTTFAIFILAMAALFKNSEEINLKRRKIPTEIVKRALMIFLLSVLFILIGIFLLSLTEDKSLLDISFEAFSAAGTVGLSRGITPYLTDPGKFIMIFLMFIGRVGPLTIIFALSKSSEAKNYKLPEENVSLL